jgi:hypothetical protein
MGLQLGHFLLFWDRVCSPVRMARETGTSPPS